MKKSLKEKIEKIAGVQVIGNMIAIKGDSELYPLPLVDGNAKIGKGVWHASTLPGAGVITLKNGDSERGTCPVTCPGCYAMTGNYCFDAIRAILMKRTRLLKKYPHIYFLLVAAQIESENVKLLRVHASGDFLPGEASGWYKIFKAYPHVIGWTYTKCEIKGEIKKLDSLFNFNIVKSIIPGCGFNYGHIDYILKTYEKLTARGESVYLCRCGIDKNQHCKDCTGCALNKYVLFIEHSTGYNAAADPLYNEIYNLIESQEKPGTFETLPAMVGAYA